MSYVLYYQLAKHRSNSLCRFGTRRAYLCGKGKGTLEYKEIILPGGSSVEVKIVYDKETLKPAIAEYSNGIPK